MSSAKSDEKTNIVSEESSKRHVIIVGSDMRTGLDETESKFSVFTCNWKKGNYKIGDVIFSDDLKKHDRIFLQIDGFDFGVRPSTHRGINIEFRFQIHPKPEGISYFQGTIPKSSIRLVDIKNRDIQIKNDWSFSLIPV